MSVPSNAMYFIWQGKNSRDNGIVMTSLPKITYAAPRYDEYKTDLGDGSTIEELGLPPIDVSFSIAYLPYRGDVGPIFYEQRNQVKILAKFFREPDTQYDKNKLVLSSEMRRMTTESDIFGFWLEAHLLTNIDFDHLAEFKTATLTFRCQPQRKIYLPEQTNYNKYHQCYQTSGASSGQTIDLTDSNALATDNRLMNRRPMIRFSLDPSESYISEFLAQPYFGVKLQLKYDEAQVTARKTCVTRTFLFSTAQLAQYLQPTSGTLLAIEMSIDTENEKFRLDQYISESSQLIHNIYDCSHALVTGITNSAVADTYVYYDYTYNLKITQTGSYNPAILLSGGRTFYTPAYQDQHDILRFDLYNANFESQTLVGFIRTLYYYKEEKIG